MVKRVKYTYLRELGYNGQKKDEKIQILSQRAKTKQTKKKIKNSNKLKRPEDH